MLLTSRNKYCPNGRKLEGRSLLYSRFIICCALACTGVMAPQSLANDFLFEWDGHLKYNPLISTYPDDSAYAQILDSPTIENTIEARLNLGLSKGHWQYDIAYQVYGQMSELNERSQAVGELNLFPPSFPDDAGRLLNLSTSLLTSDDMYVGHRIDRLSATYSRENTVFKIGRQAISWGNGLLFNPMDMFNPFDPKAVDTEYKTGDDMLYGQHLFDSGHDAQMVWVGRRDDDGNITGRVDSTALKYHGFLGGQHEYDIVLAQHYDDTVVAVGGVWGLGGAIARTDLVFTESSGESFTSGIANISYAWFAFERNMSASVEYYYNGFGVNTGEYSPQSLWRSPKLLERLSRGESYNLAQQYLGITATVEMHPLWLLTPNVLANIDDHSAFVQLVSSHDLHENARMVLSLNLPVGAEGSEFGGISAGVEGLYLSRGMAVLAQVSWYF